MRAQARSQRRQISGTLGIEAGAEEAGPRQVAAVWQAAIIGEADQLQPARASEQRFRRRATVADIGDELVHAFLMLEHHGLDGRLGARQVDLRAGNKAQRLEIEATPRAPIVLQNQAGMHDLARLEQRALVDAAIVRPADAERSRSTRRSSGV